MHIENEHTQDRQPYFCRQGPLSKQIWEAVPIEVVALLCEGFYGVIRQSGYSRAGSFL